MNQWAFVAAAYSLTAVATLALLGRSWVSMRQAEARAEAAKPQR